MIWEVDETLDSHVEWDEFLLAYRYSNILEALILMFPSLFPYFFTFISRTLCVCVCVCVSGVCGPIEALGA